MDARTRIKNMEAMLAQGRDGALLRFGLGQAYQEVAEPDKAALQLEAALRLDPEYSAAWKAYGKALESAGRGEAAAVAYERGILAAEAKGDMQAAKEMRVFRKRLDRAAP